MWEIMKLFSTSTHLPHYIKVPAKIFYRWKPILDQLKLYRKWYSTGGRLLFIASDMDWRQNSVSRLLIVCLSVCPSFCLSVCQTYRQTDGRTYVRTDRPTDRWTDGWTDRQTDRPSVCLCPSVRLLFCLSDCSFVLLHPSIHLSNNNARKKNH